MKFIQDKILVVAKPDSKTVISSALADISGIEILEADSENRAFELIYTHFFVVVIIEETLPHIDMYKIGSMLLSHKKTHNAPLLVITDKINPGQFLIDFKALHIDYLVKPFDEQLIRSKIRIFFELFKQKNAVAQSIDELDRVYKKIFTQHELATKDAFSKKNRAGRSSRAAGQMQQPLRSLQGNLSQLLRNQGIPKQARVQLSAIKAATETISRIVKQLFGASGGNRRKSLEPVSEKGISAFYTILYVGSSREDFNIFSHFVKGLINARLIQAMTIEESMETIAENIIDLIFIDYGLPDGAAFGLLSRLNRLKSDIPVIFTLDKASRHKGPEAVSKGAFSYFIKEEVSAETILSIVDGTFRKAEITREIEDAQGRIVMISQKDFLTRLYNRRCFEEALDAETSKARRYKTALSILILNFDDFSHIRETHGIDTGDQMLTTFATLIQGAVRNNDVVCRYGEDEFGIVLPNTALNGARMLAERIRKKIAGHTFKKDDAPLPVTVSIGVASYADREDDSWADLVRNALAAADAAVEQGGNRVKTLIR